VGYLGNIVQGIAGICDTLLTIYFYIVIISALISWVRPDPYNAIVRFLRNVTEPIYVYIRRYIPFVYVGGFDLSPIVLIVAIQFLRWAVVKNLYHLAGQMGHAVYPYLP
jgi:YggT family protein